MKSNLFVKLSAVASSVLLGAAFVSYRAGAFDWSSRSDGVAIETPRIPDHATGGAPPLEVVAPPAAPDADPQIFYGSKSGAVIVEPQPTPQPARSESASPQRQQSAVIMSGSKSLMPAAPRQEAVNALQQAGGR